MSARPKPGRRQLRDYLEAESKYTRLCDKKYLEELEKQLQKDYEKQQELKEEELARIEVRRERDLMLEGILSAAGSIPELESENHQEIHVEETQENKIKKKYAKYTGRLKQSPYRKAVLSRSTFPPILNKPGNDDECVLLI